MHRYTDHNLDDEFVNMLRQACLGYIERNKEPTLAEIAAFIRNKVCLSHIQDPLGFCSPCPM